MKEDMGLELAEEEQGERARICLADDTGANGPGEVVGEDPDRAARWNLLVLRIEGHDDGGRVHLHGNRGADDVAEEGDHPAGKLTEDDTRIGGCVESGDGGDEVGRGDAAIAHRRGEQLLLRREVAEDRRGRDVERAGDVGQRRRREAAGTERDARGLEDLIARDARRASHAFVNVRSRIVVCQWPLTNGSSGLPCPLPA